MKFYSLNNQNIKVSFKNAVIAGIAPDKGLYFPEHITPLSIDYFEQIEQLSDHEIAFQAIHQFVSEDIPDEALKQIIANTLDFDFPVVDIEENVGTLELFHGPTMAFKDVGARFMANCLGYFSQGEKQDVTVLVATSGDTGGAVANGFLGVDGVKVVILYPSGKVSEIQEKQLTTLGQNIEAMEVDGVFDDCQRMVKTAFLDTEITDHKKLTSANSINVARWLPQLFYFLFAYKQAKSKGKEIVFSVPSGNFGNICAGMVAQKLGMPVKHFVASTNVNDVVPKFMESGVYEPMPSVATISNAMDVGDPSNFVRIRHLYQDDMETLQKSLSSHSFTDENTKAIMKEVYSKTGYVMDPHGAVGYLGLKEYQKSNPNTFGIFLETAHPVKFLDVVEDTLDISPQIPPQIMKVMDKEKKSYKISSYDELKQFLLDD
ncbi:MAG TPA: threonine synthase [Muricauda sp.]|uniref:Threonine synthase n=1 Tax=Flagellimonas aurea TaxID=2915619 RepID=A0ABS3GA52_9FLAO|nr:threonine synthase [Allomuricauda aurea]MAO18901.1 threonine synthase [Allomuricauda sp.]MBC73208.1 threonine synthase [Allomuricauda sp.]MBO0356158.1 threonine synthase [Allomuricauda aurea]HBU76784.1 threonine synthase [Allomuricauda sp.]